MNNLQVFENPAFGQVRTVLVNNEPYFCMADICKALKISNISQARTRLKEDGVILNEATDSLGRTQEANFVNESNMYKLIFQSRKREAESFTDWVTSEVLPSIRKTGTYQKPMSALDQIMLAQKALLEVNDKVQAVDADLQEFKKDMPLLGIEESKITSAVKRKGVKCLGGKNSEAYHDSSIRQKVFSDIYRELKRQFGVGTYKAIKRGACERAIKIVEGYEPPLVLAELIEDCNAQLSI